MADELNLDTLEAERNALLRSPNYADSVAAEFYGNMAYPALVAEVRRLYTEYMELAGMAGTWCDQLRKEEAENKRLQVQLARAEGIIYECTADGCLYDEETGGWDSLGLESLGDALRFLAEHGLVELVDKPGYSGVIARLPASKEAGQE